MVVGQYKTGEAYGAIYEKGSANAATIDKIIQAMIDDGTMTSSAPSISPRPGARTPRQFPISNNHQVETPAVPAGVSFSSQAKH